VKNLIKIIGLSPSELTPEDFLEKLRAERSRARNAIVSYLESSKTTKSRGITKTALSKALAEAGVTPEQFKLLLKESANGGGE